MSKIFLDTNVVLDVIQDRAAAPYVRAIFEYVQGQKWSSLYTSYLSIANSAYILRKRPHDEVKLALKAFMKVCNILHMNDMQIIRAFECNSPDFEDCLQIQCAEFGECDVILTSNVEHFRGYTDIPVLTPEEFVSHCAQA